MSSATPDTNDSPSPQAVARVHRYAFRLEHLAEMYDRPDEVRRYRRLRHRAARRLLEVGERLRRADLP